MVNTGYCSSRGKYDGLKWCLQRGRKVNRLKIPSEETLQDLVIDGLWEVRKLNESRFQA